MTRFWQLGATLVLFTGLAGCGVAVDQRALQATAAPPPQASPVETAPEPVPETAPETPEQYTPRISNRICSPRGSPLIGRPPKQMLRHSLLGASPD